MTSFVEPHASATTDPETQLDTDDKVDNRPTEQQLRDCMTNFNCCGYIAFTILTQFLDLRPEEPCPEDDNDIYFRAREFIARNYDEVVTVFQCEAFQRLVPECHEPDVGPFISTGLHIDDLRFIADVCGNWKFLEPDPSEIERVARKYDTDRAIAKIMVTEFKDQKDAVKQYIVESFETIKRGISALLHAEDQEQAYRELSGDIEEMQDVIAFELYNDFE